MGAVFATPSHAGAQPASPGLLAATAGRVTVPLAGIGGITAANVGEVMKAGAAGAAVIRAILGAEDPRRAARELRNAMDEAAGARQVSGAGERVAMITLTVNGKPRYVDGSVDLVSFLESYDVNLQHVAVGYNGIVLEKDRYPEVLLKEGRRAGDRQARGRRVAPQGAPSPTARKQLGRGGGDQPGSQDLLQVSPGPTGGRLGRSWPTQSVGTSTV